MDQDTVEQETKDLTLDWSEGGPGALIQASMGIDMKLIGILAASSVLMGVTVSLAGVGGVASTWSGWPLVAFLFAAAAWIINFAGTLYQVWPKMYHRSDDPTNMEDYWSQQPAAAREARWTYLQRAYENNFKVLSSKANWLKYSTALLGVETIALVVWLFAVSLQADPTSSSSCLSPC